MAFTFFAPGDRRSTEWKTYGPVRQVLGKVVDRKNAAGGVADRKVRPNWALDAVDGGAPDAARLSAICRTAIRGHSSFAVQPTDRGGSLGRLTRSGCVRPSTSVVFIPDRIVDATGLDDLPGVVAPYAVEDVTAARLLVQRLVAQGFFEGSRRVAVLNPSGEFDTAVRMILTRELLLRAQVSDPIVITEGAGSRAETNSLVRRLRSENVDRVVYFDDAPSMGGVVRSMIEQKYSPRLGTVLSAQPDWVGSLGDYPADRLFAVSWLGPDPGVAGTTAVRSIPDTPATKKCVKTQEALGIEVSRIAVVLEACDMLSLMDDAFDAGGAKPSTASFYAGLAKLDSFPSAYGVPLNFTYGRTGATQVWDLRGDSSCRCLKATGGPYRVAD